MTEYVEPTLRARQLFFLAIILLGGFALFISRLDVFLPPLSDPDQMRDRLLVAIVLSNIFHIALSIEAIYYTRRAVQSGQWPPKGMAVPFRTKIKKIKNPRNAWLLLTVMLFGFAFNTLLPWLSYAKHKELDKEIKQLIIRSEEFKKKYEVPPNPALKRDSAKAALLLRPLAPR